jgi:hypothetical protein
VRKKLSFRNTVLTMALIGSASLFVTLFQSENEVTQPADSNRQTEKSTLPSEKAKELRDKQRKYHEYVQSRSRLMASVNEAYDAVLSYQKSADELDQRREKILAGKKIVNGEVLMSEDERLALEFLQEEALSNQNKLIKTIKELKKDTI